MEKITIEKVKNTQNWDKELSKHSGSIFLSRSWLEAIKSTEKNPVYYFFTQGKKIIAMIAGLERPIGKGPHKQLFFYSGIASSAANPGLLKQCKKILLDYSRKMSYYRVIIKSYDYNNYIAAKVKNYQEYKRYECVINLSPARQEVVNSIHRDTRRRARKATKSGASFKSGRSAQLLETLFTLMRSTQGIRVSKGYGEYHMFSMPFLNKEVMIKLLEANAATLYYIEYNGEIVSIQFVVASEKRAYAIWMGTSINGYKIGAPSLLFYEIILSLKEEGFSSYNMGAVPVGIKNLGIRNYKLNWGAEILESCEEATDFLIHPFSRLNSLMYLKRKVNDLRMPWKIKKVLLNIPDALIKGRDEY